MKKIIALALIVLISTPAFAGITVGSLNKRNLVSQSSTVISASSIPFTKATVCANPSNTGKVGIGASTILVSVDSTVNTGPSLSAGTCIELEGPNQFINGDLKDYYISSTTSGDSVGIVYSLNSIG